jgi:hypothetical protein
MAVSVARINHSVAARTKGSEGLVHHVRSRVKRNGLLGGCHRGTGGRHTLHGP